MGLYEALRELLIQETAGDAQPIERVFLNRLPARQVAADGVDVACVLLAGLGPTTSYGRKRVQWYHTGVRFDLRGCDPLAVERSASQIRDVLVLIAGAPRVEEGERIMFVEVETSPYFAGQDDQERSLASLQVEVRHLPEPDAAR